MGRGGVGGGLGLVKFYCISFLFVFISTVFRTDSLPGKTRGEIRRKILLHGVRVFETAAPGALFLLL